MKGVAIIVTDLLLAIKAWAVVLPETYNIRTQVYWTIVSELFGSGISVFLVVTKVGNCIYITHLHATKEI